MIGLKKSKASKKIAATPDRRKRKAEPVDLIISGRIRQRRQELGLSQVELAKKLGISLQQIGKYEGGDNRVSAARLFDIANALDVSVMWFFKDIDHRVDADHFLPTAVRSLDEVTVKELLKTFADLSTQDERRTAIALVATLARHAAKSGSILFASATPIYYLLGEFCA